MSRTNVLWVVFLLLGLVFGAVSIVLLSRSTSGVFGWITLVCAMVILVCSAVAYRRARLHP
ncbi:hypothetical protein [Curtobacterium sp. 458]|uniref:hypothetical protein n=1 Tax=Curtobacterium sp. 458 TaxID=3050069 RepID=UPI0025B5AA5A|nr:hypothetical protein [Curtobacterium sp. 458]WJY01577.1 hypothetical protein QPJ90_07725 [Curtobacterium sp. 458]